MPPDLRFYAGGGGSVRGYAYQHVSPRDAAGNLLGGRSVGEDQFRAALSRLEGYRHCRLRRCRHGFDQHAYFAGADTPRIGAGLGLRYYTSFGPLRLDVGVPLNPHSSDSPVQIYISLGQAF